MIAEGKAFKGMLLKSVRDIHTKPLATCGREGVIRFGFRVFVTWAPSDHKLMAAFVQNESAHLALVSLLGDAPYEVFAMGAKGGLL